jgi:hypothetical protein
VSLTRPVSVHVIFSCRRRPLAASRSKLPRSSSDANQRESALSVQPHPTSLPATGSRNEQQTVFCSKTLQRSRLECPYPPFPLSQHPSHSWNGRVSFARWQRLLPTLPLVSGQTPGFAAGNVGTGMPSGRHHSRSRTTFSIAVPTATG